MSPSLLSTLAQVALLFHCPEHEEDDPFFEGVQSTRFLVPFGHHRGVQLCHRHRFASAPLPMLELFSSNVSVDQDLSVIVAEAINDDDVKQRLVPLVFTRA